MIFINTRSLAHRMTGVQRYLIELLKNFSINVERMSPSLCRSGLSGHLWEQSILPLRTRDGVLFSPANTGPILKARQVVTIHDLATLDHPEWFNKNFASWYGYVLRQLIRKSEHVIAVSSFTKQRILEIANVSDKKVTHIPNGVSNDFYIRSSEDIRVMLSALKLPSSNYVLALGSIEPRKNIYNLLKAWAIISKDIPIDVWLVIVGGLGSAKVFAGSRLDIPTDRVYYTGYVDDRFLPSLYSGARAFVYPSLYEGFGLPSLEAMACGAPVIVSKGTAMEEFVKDAGILVNPLDAEDIAFSLAKVLTDNVLREALSAKSVISSKKYSWVETARRTEDVISSLQ